MHLKQFEYVQEIARQGSIKVAAEKLYISQQALSESLRSLEAELEFIIFKRTNRGIVLTETGERFLHDINTIMPIIHGWKDYKAQPSMKLFVQYALGDLLVDARFMQYLSRAEKLGLQYETLNLANVLEETTQKNPCLSLVTLREGSSYRANIEAMRKSGEYIFEELVDRTHSQMSILLRADSTQLQTGDEVDLNDLAGKTLVINKDQIKLDLVKQICHYTKKIARGLPYTVKPTDIVAQNKNAITFMPKFIADENFYVKTGVLVACPMKQYVQDEWRVYVVYPVQWTEQVTPVIHDLKQMFGTHS